MARTKNKIAPNDERAVVAMDKMQKEIEKIEELYGDGLPFDQSRLEIGIKARTAAVAATMIQNGRDYHRLKAHLPHGEFIAAVERTSGRSRFWAYHCMRAAETFSNVAPGNIQDLSFSQIKTLSMLEKPVVEEYLKGGPLGDIPHDDVATMPRGELEDEARRLRGKEKNMKGLHKKEVEKLNEIIDDLKIRAEDPMQLTPAQRAHRLIRSTYTREYNVALSEISAGIRKARSVLADAERTEGIGAQELNEWLNEFVPDSAMIMELISQWQAETENPAPIVDNFNDIITGKTDV
jgi:hypothetical protein